MVPRVHARAAGRAERVLRVPLRSARAAVPGGAAPPEGCGGHLVLQRRRRRTPTSARARARGRHAAARRRQPVPLPALHSAFDAVYPAGDQWYWRGDYFSEIPDAAIEKHVEFAQEAADMEVDDAPLPVRRRGGARRCRRDAVGLPRREVDGRLRRRRSRSGERGARSRRGRSTTGRRCTRTRWAART